MDFWSPLAYYGLWTPEHTNTFKLINSHRKCISSSTTLFQRTPYSIFPHKTLLDAAPSQLSPNLAHQLSANLGVSFPTNHTWNPWRQECLSATYVSHSNHCIFFGWMIRLRVLPVVQNYEYCCSSRELPNYFRIFGPSLNSTKSVPDFVYSVAVDIYICFTLYILCLFVCLSG